MSVTSDQWISCWTCKMWLLVTHPVFWICRRIYFWWKNLFQFFPIYDPSDPTFRHGTELHHEFSDRLFSRWQSTEAFGWVAERAYNIWPDFSQSQWLRMREIFLTINVTMKRAVKQPTLVDANTIRWIYLQTVFGSKLTVNLHQLMQPVLRPEWHQTTWV